MMRNVWCSELVHHDDEKKLFSYGMCNNSDSLIIISTLIQTHMVQTECAVCWGAEVPLAGEAEVAGSGGRFRHTHSPTSTHHYSCTTKLISCTTKTMTIKNFTGALV